MKTKRVRVKVIRNAEWEAGRRAGRTELRAEEWQKAYDEGFAAGELSQTTKALQEANTLREENAVIAAGRALAVLEAYAGGKRDGGLEELARIEEAIAKRGRR